VKENRVTAFWREKARQLNVETYTLYFAYRDPRTPWYAKGFTALIVAYAFSPIDLIPDFIPVLGYLDDLIIIPLGVMIALKLIPPPVIAESRAKATEFLGSSKPQYKIMAIVIIGIWIAVLFLAGWIIYHNFFA
jgi:uncharacterized membrane protein YkvA (DUF1232 family)